MSYCIANMAIEQLYSKLKDLIPSASNEAPSLEHQGTAFGSKGEGENHFKTNF